MGHMAHNQTSIKFNLNSNLISLGTNWKLDGIHGAKLRIQLNSNWIFFEFWLYIYIERERERERERDYQHTHSQKEK